MTSPTPLQAARPSSQRVPDTRLDWQHAPGRAATEYVLLTEGLAALLGVDTDPAPPTGDR
ncbi:hypothetical protein [Streptomyces sp. NPDC054834]